MKDIQRSLFFILLVGAVSCISAQQTISGEVRGIKVAITLEKETASITVSAPMRGWVAVGIDPTDKMKDADFKIGYIQNGTVFVRDDFGTNPITHRPDTDIGGTSDILSFSGSETNGVTMITFVVPRFSKDQRDKQLPSGSVRLILGASHGDSFTAKHTVVGSLTLNLP
ncbi:MAG: DOMON domain-containing protein [Termitinemataceae bacterium]